MSNEATLNIGSAGATLNGLPTDATPPAVTIAGTEEMSSGISSDADNGVGNNPAINAADDINPHDQNQHSQSVTDGDACVDDVSVESDTRDRSRHQVREESGSQRFNITMSESIGGVGDGDGNNESPSLQHPPSSIADSGGDISSLRTSLFVVSPSLCRRGKDDARRVRQRHSIDTLHLMTTTTTSNTIDGAAAACCTGPLLRTSMGQRGQATSASFRSGTGAGRKQHHSSSSVRCGRCNSCFDDCRLKRASADEPFSSSRITSTASATTVCVNEWGKSCCRHCHRDRSHHGGYESVPPPVSGRGGSGPESGTLSITAAHHIEPHHIEPLAHASAADIIRAKLLPATSDVGMPTAAAAVAAAVPALGGVAVGSSATPRFRRSVDSTPSATTCQSRAEIDYTSFNIVAAASASASSTTPPGQTGLTTVHRTASSNVYSGRKVTPNTHQPPQSDVADGNALLSVVSAVKTTVDAAVAAGANTQSSSTSRPTEQSPQQLQQSRRQQDEAADNNKLLIKLYYNPVMDEWISLTETGVDDDRRRSQTLDVLFDLNKKIGRSTRNHHNINNSVSNISGHPPSSSASSVVDGNVGGPAGQFQSVGSLAVDDLEIIQVSHFLAALEMTGLRRTDPRLQPMMANLRHIHQHHYPGESFDALALNRQHFKLMICDNIDLLARAFKNQFVIPEFVSFCDNVKDIYEMCLDNKSGQVATYIPQLAKVDPDQFGISICTIDGQRFSIGNATTPFTMQSSSKPFSYAVCLNELGAGLVHSYVGQEPSGRVFNELSLDAKNKPHNPLLNSGAIMSAALLTYLVRPDMQASEKFDFVTDQFRRIAGNEFVGFSNSIFLSERETADRNYALAYYMKENKSFPAGFRLQDCLDFYFQTCSMEINCETAAVMGATLAKGGRCPITEDEVLKPLAVRDVLSLMHSCGMYNYSGEFAFNVGLPSKSGVSGSLIMVVPNVMGIGVWSPPLDALGNTVRGVQFAHELVKRFTFHRFDSLVNQTVSKINPRLFCDEISRQAVMSHLYAATTGDLIALKRFYYNLGADLSEPNYDGRTALHLAAAEGHLSCVKFLVDKCGLQPQAKDRWGFTPLSEAKRFGHHRVYDYLIKCLTERHLHRLHDSSSGLGNGASTATAVAATEAAAVVINGRTVGPGMVVGCLDA